MLRICLLKLLIPTLMTNGKIKQSDGYIEKPASINAFEVFHSIKNKILLPFSFLRHRLPIPLG